jgi:hypothetical protein
LLKDAENTLLMATQAVNLKERQLRNQSGLTTAQRKTFQDALDAQKVKLGGSTQRLTELLTPLTAADFKVGIGLRIYTELGDTQVELVHLGDQTLPLPPAPDPNAPAEN